jgi:hypothetical protein
MGFEELVDREIERIGIYDFIEVVRKEGWVKITNKKGSGAVIRSFEEKITEEIKKGINKDLFVYKYSYTDYRGQGVVHYNLIVKEEDGDYEYQILTENKGYCSALKVDVTKNYERVDSMKNKDIMKISELFLKVIKSLPEYRLIGLFNK